MPNFLSPLDTHCVYVTNGFSFVGTIGVMDCI